MRDGAFRQVVGYLPRLALPRFGRGCGGSGPMWLAHRTPRGGSLFGLAHDLEEEAAWNRVAGLAPFEAGEGEGKGQPFLGPGDADVAETAFFFHVVGIGLEAAMVGQNAFLQADHINVW